MDWQAIGAVGEVLGAVGVITTLIYLAAQIRQNNQQLHISTSWNIHEGMAALNSRWADNAEMADILWRGMQEPASLSPLENQRFWMHTMDALNLAVFTHGVKRAQKITPGHMDAVRMVGGLYQQYPKFRAAVDSVADGIPDPALLEEIRAQKPLRIVDLLS